jgi:hypothetical protein
MRVVAQRLPADQAGPAPLPAQAADVPAPAPATGGVAALDEAPLPSPDIVGLPARRERPLPVLDRRTPRRPFSRLLALVRGRRRAEVGGRHRPDTIPSSGWSMFAPHRRSRRRFGARR